LAQFFNLLYELEYYKHYNYEIKNTNTKVTYCVKDAWEDGLEDGAIIPGEILKTPFNWEGYDKPYWWGEPENDETEPIPPPIEELIQQGESNKVEFKTTLHFRTSKETIKIHDSIPKTICAFLNSNGGLLFVGIKDNKAIEGLGFDFSLANGNNPKDYFLLEFDKMLQDFIGFSIKSNISGEFYEIEEKEIFYISVRPSKNRIIFLKGKEGKELYVRGVASTRQIKDPEEIINYWKDKFG